MNNSISGHLSTVLILSTFSTTPALAQTVQTYTQTYPPGVVTQTTTLGSWMQPVVVRTREITSDNGDKLNIVEPIIMERHERVLVPMTTTTTTTSTDNGRRVLMTTNPTVMSSQRMRPHILHHRRHYEAFIDSTGNSYISRRTVIESRPTVLRQKEQVVERSVIIERRDPSLDAYF